jgi:hypothetical protein
MASSEHTASAHSNADAHPDAGSQVTGAGGSQAANASAASGPVAASLTALRCSYLMNARYHATREAFLDNVHRWFMFAVIMLGAGALIDIFPHPAAPQGSVGPKELFAASTAVIAALDLTFDLSNRARTHSLMKTPVF